MKIAPGKWKCCHHVPGWQLNWDISFSDWCNKGHGMHYPVCGMVHIKDPLLIIEKSNLCNGSSGFLTHCLNGHSPHVWHLIAVNVLGVLLNKTFTFFPSCVRIVEGRKEMFYLTTHSTHFIYGYMASNMVEDHSDGERGIPLPPHRLLFPINSKGSFICTIPQTGLHIPQPLLHQSWSTGWNEKYRSE